MNDKIKIVITGDTYLGGGRVKELALKNNVEQLFGSFIEVIKSADLAITNLEAPCIDKGTPYPKIGPNLKSPTKSLRILKSAGFHLLTLANNHIMDFGKKGLQYTLKESAKIGINCVGAGVTTKKAKQPLSIEMHRISIAIINIAENEFGTTVSGSAGANALNPVKNFYQIKEVRSNFDHVIVIIHGGHENYELPSPRMKETYRFFVDAGATAVVGHHTHCCSGYEVYKNAPIFYSVGNFLFDDGSFAKRKWNEGFICQLKIKKDKLDFDIIPYIQNAEKAGLRKLSNEEHQMFNQNIKRLNDVIHDDENLKEGFKNFCKSSQKLYSSYIEPHSNRYLHALRNRKLFPSFLSDRKKRLLLNLTRCESHRDILQNILENENSYTS